MTHLKYACSFLILLSILAGCGRKGALLPPEALVPAAVQDLKVQQSGNEFRLTWSAPDREKGGRPLRDLSGFRLYKRIIAGDGSDCSECPDAWNLLASVDAANPQGAGRSGPVFTHFDREIPSGQTSQYRLVAFSNSGGVSPPATSPLRKFRSPLPPPALKAAALPASIRLDFAYPADGQNRVAGFNVYRRQDKKTAPLLPVNPLPIKETVWEDMQVAFGQSYSYSATALLEINGETVESLRSPEIDLNFNLQELR